MRDEALTTPAGLSPAEAAVLYLLMRVRVDTDLRYHMLHTEAFARLCAAEAARLTASGSEEVTADIVAELYSTPAAHTAGERPRLQQCQSVIRDAITELESHRVDATDWLTDVIYKLERVS